MATPPITPPTIAPTCELDEEDVGAEAGGVVAGDVDDESVRLVVLVADEEVVVAEEAAEVEEEDDAARQETSVPFVTRNESDTAEIPSPFTAANTYVPPVTLTLGHVQF